jgi:hypothetical protein
VIGRDWPAACDDALGLRVSHGLPASTRARGDPPPREPQSTLRAAGWSLDENRSRWSTSRNGTWGCRDGNISNVASRNQAAKGRTP